MSLIKGTLENSKIQGMIAFNHEVEAKQEPIERTIIVLDEIAAIPMSNSTLYMEPTPQRYIVMDDVTKEIGVINKVSLAGMKIIG